MTLKKTKCNIFLTFNVVMNVIYIFQELFQVTSVPKVSFIYWIGNRSGGFGIKAPTMNHNIPVSSPAGDFCCMSVSISLS